MTPPEALRRDRWFTDNVEERVAFGRGARSARLVRLLLNPTCRPGLGLPPPAGFPTSYRGSAPPACRSAHRSRPSSTHWSPNAHTMSVL